VFELSEKKRPWSKSEPTLLVGNGKDIRQTNPAYGQQHVTCDEFVARAVAVDFDNTHNVVFWTDVRNQNISRSAPSTVSVGNGTLFRWTLFRQIRLRKG